MKNQSYQLFMETLLKKEPNKKILAGHLAELLYMEKEAVYRRLRQTVNFTFEEIDLIAKKYHISLDHITSHPHYNNSLIFHLMDYDFINTSKENIEYTQNYIERISTIKNDPGSEVGVAVNTLPLSLIKSNDHTNIFRFIVYKWMYLYGNCKLIPPFTEFLVTEQLLKFNDEYRKTLTHANYTYYIFDEDMFNNVLKDIKYFQTIEYITEEEVNTLKSELLNFLNYIESLTIQGEFKTGKRVDFFITQMSIESSYSYIDSPDCCLVFLKVFTLTDAISHNPHDISRIKEWIKSLKKSCSQISVTGELQRIKYFGRQREIINQL